VQTLQNIKLQEMYTFPKEKRLELKGTQKSELYSSKQA
jgi:hypothetical protein